MKICPPHPTHKTHKHAQLWRRVHALLQWMKILFLLCGPFLHFRYFRYRKPHKVFQFVFLEKNLSGYRLRCWHESKMTTSKLKVALKNFNTLWTGISTVLKRFILVFLRYFQLGDVKIPNDVQKRYLLTLTRQLDSEKEKFVQVCWGLSTTAIVCLRL